jgi:hypothetical protein
MKMKALFIFSFCLTASLLQSFVSFSQETTYGDLSEGVRAFVKNGKMGFVDEKNNIVQPAVFDFPEYANLPVFRDGMCMFYQKIETNDESYRYEFNFGYLNSEFKIAIVAMYPYDENYCHGLTASFSGGYAIVNKLTEENETIFFLIDKTGKQSGPSFGAVNTCTAACYFYPEIAEGRVVVRRESKCGYMESATGKMIIPYNFTAAGPFSEGVAAVEINGRYITIINKNGTPVTNKKFYTTQKGSANRSLYGDGNRCTDPGGFVKGKMIIHFYDNDGSGPAVFGLIDKQGNLLLKKKIDDVSSDPDFKSYEWRYGDPH